MDRILRRILVLSAIGASFVAGQALADATQLRSALQHLQAARNDLEVGGRKNDDAKQALNKVELAIEDVRKGIEEEQRKEQKAAKEAAKQKEKAAQQEQKSQERAVQQEQKSQEKAAQQEKKAQEKAAEQAKKAQKKGVPQGQTIPAQ